MRSHGRLSLALAALLVAAPAAAYTIHMKDGSKLVAKKKYEVRGDKAIITLPSGQRTQIALTEIDVERTEKANAQDLGTAILIEGGQAKDLGEAAPPAPKKPGLGDLIRAGEAGVQGPDGDEAETEAIPAGPVGPAARPRGFDDRPVTAPNGRPPLRDKDLAGSLMGFVAGRGLGVEVFQGNSSRRPLLLYETESEATVFRSLLATAAALIEIRDKRPGSVEALEMICQTADGAPAAHFTLTPAQAADLLSGKAEITRFFVDNVEF